MTSRLSVLIILLIGYVDVAMSQSSAPENWFNLDVKKDGVYGISTEKAYQELLKGKEPLQSVVVALIGSGLDITHEDLKGAIWVNKGEIPNNGKDDDENGYVDDVHGWNFIGGKDGKNVVYDTHEITRMYRDLKQKQRSKEEEILYRKLKEEYENKRAHAKSRIQLTNDVLYVGEDIAKLLNKSNYTAEDIKQVKVSDSDMKRRLNVMENLLRSFKYDYKTFKENMERELEYFEDQVNYYYNVEFDSRAIVGDDDSDFNDRLYGNHDVTGPDADFGTHAAGVIAARRHNNIGIDGITNDVKIMGVRIVPNGDERDKDVANGIRYAVDNGAHIICLSFSKEYSPYKKEVDAAVKYAAKHDVLLVHLAGSGGLDLDKKPQFPSKQYLKKGKNAKNWIEVGVTSWKRGSGVVANFTNYGKETVDLFAPGVDIKSTISAQEYETYSGASMAAAVVAGAAALVLAYYPELSAIQLKEVLLTSVEEINTNVILPGSKDEKALLQELSRTGGVVNVYNALEKASLVKGLRK